MRCRRLRVDRMVIRDLGSSPGPTQPRQSVIALISIRTGLSVKQVERLCLIEEAQSSQRILVFRSRYDHIREERGPAEENDDPQEWVTPSHFWTLEFGVCIIVFILDIR